MDRMQPFIDKHLRTGSQQRAAFECICKKGSNPNVLFAFFTLALDVQKLSVWQLLQVDSWSRSQWKKLPRELDNLAAKIESFTKNESFIKTLTLYWTSCVPSITPVDARLRRQLNTYQSVMPQLLRNLGTTIRSADFLITTNAGPKRLDTRRLFILQLLAYVRQTTGKPCWADVARMLDSDPDILKKQWRHALGYGFVPKQS